MCDCDGRMRQNEHDDVMMARLCESPPGGLVGRTYASPGKTPKKPRRHRRDLLVTQMSQWPPSGTKDTIRIAGGISKHTEVSNTTKAVDS